MLPQSVLLNNNCLIFNTILTEIKHLYEFVIQVANRAGELLELLWP